MFKRFISFAVSFVGADGASHHTVEQYDRLTGTVRTSQASIAVAAKSAKKMDYEFDRFLVRSDGAGKFEVVDTVEDKAVAAYSSEAEAKDRADYENCNCIWLGYPRESQQDDED